MTKKKDDLYLIRWNHNTESHFVAITNDLDKWLKHNNSERDDDEQETLEMFDITKVETHLFEKDEYSDRQINSMITFLRVKKIAEIQYIDKQSIDSKTKKGIDGGDLTLYDYMSNSHLTLSQVISSAIDSGWKEDWVVS